MSKREIDKYRDDILGFTAHNLLTVTKNPSFTEKENAGTALLLAAQAIGVAAAAIAKTEPHLENAPFEAQVDDALGLIRETLCKKKKPDLHIVKDTSP